jgi:hypothetical protein
MTLTVIERSCSPAEVSVWAEPAALSHLATTEIEHAVGCVSIQRPVERTIVTFHVDPANGNNVHPGCGPNGFCLRQRGFRSVR